MQEVTNEKELKLRSELITALKEFQQTCPSIAKDKEGYGYKYTPLEKFLSVVNPALHKVGLIQNQTYDFQEGRTIIVTTLSHENGYTITSRLPLREPQGKNPKKDVMHEWGGITTYSRRYALKMILGLEPDMDMNLEDVIDRGNSNEKKPAPWKKPELTKVEGVSDSDQPLSEEARNLAIGLVKEIKLIGTPEEGKKNLEQFVSDFCKHFDLPKGTKVQGKITAVKHEEFIGAWKPHK